MSREWLRGLRGKIYWSAHSESLLLYCQLLCFPRGAPLGACEQCPPQLSPCSLQSFPCVSSPMGDGQDQDPLLWIFLGGFVPLCSQARVQRSPVRLGVMHWSNSLVVLQSCCHWGVCCPLSPRVCYVWDTGENATANCFSVVCCKAQTRVEEMRSPPGTLAHFSLLMLNTKWSKITIN